MLFSSLIPPPLPLLPLLHHLHSIALSVFYMCSPCLRYCDCICLFDADPSSTPSSCFISCITYCFSRMDYCLGFFIRLDLFIPIKIFICAIRSVVSILLLIFFPYFYQIRYLLPHPRTTTLLPIQSSNFLLPPGLITQKLPPQLSCNFPLPLYWMYCTPDLLNPSNSISWFHNSFYPKIGPNRFLVKGAWEAVSSLSPCVSGKLSVLPSHLIASLAGYGFLHTCTSFPTSFSLTFSFSLSFSWSVPFIPFMKVCSASGYWVFGRYI